MGWILQAYNCVSKFNSTTVTFMTLIVVSRGFDFPYSRGPFALFSDFGYMDLLVL